MSSKYRCLRAVTELGPGSCCSGDIANKLVANGMVWSPSHGDIAFKVPMFDSFMRRIMTGADWEAD